MVLAVTQINGDLAGVLELYRERCTMPFQKDDEEIAKSYLFWGGIASHYEELYYSSMKKKELNDFMLSVVKWIIHLKDILGNI